MAACLLESSQRAAAAPNASSDISSGHAAPSDGELSSQWQLRPGTELGHATSYSCSYCLTEQLNQAVIMMWGSASCQHGEAVGL